VAVISAAKRNQQMWAAESGGKKAKRRRIENREKALERHGSAAGVAGCLRHAQMKMAKASAWQRYRV
jgi:hypothetical protein